MTPWRVGIAAVVIVVFALVIAGVGTGSPPKGDPPPRAADVAAAKRRLASSDVLKRGRDAFESNGCEDCHAIAAIGAEGKLGPRLDTVDDSVEENVHNIVDPRDDIAEGYEQNSKLMPTDFSKRMTPAQLEAVATFIRAMSGQGEAEGAGGAKGEAKAKGEGEAKGDGD